MQPQPGLLRELTGTDVRDFTLVSPAEDSDPDRPVFNDVLTPLEGTEILSTYKTSYYAGEASLTEKKLGRGRTIHLGSAFSRKIAEELHRSPSTISRELKRNKTYKVQLRYSPEQASLKYKNRRKHCHRQLRLKEPETYALVVSLLQRFWSPVQRR